MRLFLNQNIIHKKNQRNFNAVIITRRLFLISFLLSILGIVIFSKIFELSILNQNKLANSDSIDKKKEYIFRGIVKDRNGKILATNIFKYKLKAYPKLIKNPEETAEILKKNIKDLDTNRVIKKISDKSKYEVVIARNITAKKAKYFNSLGIPGLEFFPAVKRFYPHSNLTSHFVGHTNNSLKGINGIEKTYDEKLSSGEDITLSMDLRIQHAIREELLKDALAFNSKTATAILADLNTNEIIAMVSLPDYNPNLSINPSLSSYRNTATLNLYEMGSTFKIFSLAAGFEYADLKLNSSFDVSKPLKISRYTIKDYHPQNKVLSTKEVFLKSSNKGASLIALKLGGANLRNFYNNLGLLDYSLINFIERSKPMYPGKWGDIETANLSFGYGISITPIHLIQATSLVFSNSKFENMKLELQKTTNKKHTQFLSDSTKKKLLHLMEENVLKGTGKNAYVKGYGIGGKTATAEKVKKNEGVYDKRKLVSSFLSIFPIKSPKYICLVLFDEPFLKNNFNENYGATGGKTAAKTTSKIIRRIAPLLGIERKYFYDEMIVNLEKGDFNLASF